MLTTEEQDILRRAIQAVPQIEKFLEQRIQTELTDLPRVSLDKVQIFQGRLLAMQELLADLRHAAGITANRNAKPSF